MFSYFDVHNKPFYSSVVVTVCLDDNENAVKIDPSCCSHPSLTKTSWGHETSQEAVRRHHKGFVGYCPVGRLRLIVTVSMDKESAKVGFG